MSKTAKPLWRVLSESNSAKSPKQNLRVYHVIAPELESTSKGVRSNEWNVKEVCSEKGFNIIGTMFLGMCKQIPNNAIDLATIPTFSEELEDEKKPKKPFKKQYFKKGKQ